ncbi:DUF1776-domain-containing protein [Morchella conica CCBAS932]|uniref:DUF1776-domain-containing protein n=1 Tax=Morchella conica CCBAS932 TaxID=1392247 RepID=A0A3N4KP91_9PEZI|nr:DUF1776-domain-containing protein [Morchella conica CCBAS932]
MADQLQEQLTNLAWTLKSQLFTAADMLDRQADLAATLIRETLSSTPWLPEAARPPPPPPPPPLARIIPRAGMGRWVKDNKWAVGIVVATGVGIGAWVYGKRKQRRRAGRRARKAADGGRKEVVGLMGPWGCVWLVLAGSPHDPVARSLALDLDRRGFIVFVAVSTVEDEQVVINEGRADVRPLNIDILDPDSSQSAIEKFHTYLTTPIPSFPGAHPHRLHFSGLILLPTTSYPTGPLETLPLEHWSDTLNLKLLSPILTTKLLLRPICETHARIILCTPNIIPPLSPPFHAPECAAVAALHGIAASLRRELAPSAVSVCLMKLGTFDTAAAMPGGGKGVQLLNAARADILGWAPGARAAYARGYAAMRAGGAGGGVRGSPLRELHRAVAEALTCGVPREVVYVGGGSVVYEVLGRWAPEWVVGWWLGCGAGVGVGKEEGGGWWGMGGGNGGSAGGSGSVSEGEWERV